MNLDPGTLGLVLLFLYLGNALLAGLMALSGRSFSGASAWVAAQALLVVAAAAWAVRPWTPPWVAAVVGNSAFVASFVTYCHAVWLFRFESKFPWWPYGLIPVVSLSFLGVFQAGDLGAAVLLSFWTMAGALAVTVLLLTRMVHPYRAATLVTSLPFLATALGSFARLLWNLNPVSPEEVAWLNAAYLLGTVLFSTVTLFGFFMMNAIRTEGELHRKDAELQARNRELLESGRAKDLFFSIIAHDLRGPIGGSARYVRKHLLGKMSGLEAKHAEVETLASALEKTNDFLEKLLWWSRSQLQDWVPPRAPVDLGRVLEQVEALQGAAADLKEIRLSFPSGPLPTAWADAESVQIILNNLVSNAIKFTMPGRSVTVEVSSSEGQVLLAVQDEGVGMDEATVARLFRIEDKLSTHGTTGERGSGLGLLLSRSLAQRNQGDIAIVSRPGLGTRATLRLPASGPGPGPA